jgi:transcriptional regulator with XRE-family HTH domain
MKTHDEMVAEWKKDPNFLKEYDALEDEFELLEQLVSARKKAGLTQEDVAERMGTKAPAIARLETGGGRLKHSPSLSTLKRYALAVGCDLKITLEPKRKRPGLHDRKRRKPQSFGAKLTG